MSKLGTYATIGDAAIQSIADLVEVDYNGEYGCGSMAAKLAIEAWRRNSAAARRLIDGLGLAAAVAAYEAAWEQAHCDEYGLDSEEE